MVSLDELGRAIHAARRVGGPWGPPCGYPTYEPKGLTCTDCGHLWEEHNSTLVPYGCSVVDWSSIDCVNGFQGLRPEKRWVTVDYDDNSQDGFACECESMAHHLIEIMDENRKN